MVKIAQSIEGGACYKSNRRVTDPQRHQRAMMRSLIANSSKGTVDGEDCTTGLGRAGGYRKGLLSRQ